MAAQQTDKFWQPLWLRLSIPILALFSSVTFGGILAWESNYLFYDCSLRYIPTILIVCAYIAIFVTIPRAIRDRRGHLMWIPLVFDVAAIACLIFYFIHALDLIENKPLVDRVELIADVIFPCSWLLVYIVMFVYSASRLSPLGIIATLLLVLALAVTSLSAHLRLPPLDGLLPFLSLGLFIASIWAYNLSRQRAVADGRRVGNFPIIALLFLQAWFVNVELNDVTYNWPKSYRAKERHEARVNYDNSRKSGGLESARSKWKEELRLLQVYLDTRVELIIGVIAVANLVALGWFLLRRVSFTTNTT